jgi:hypothetical protein
VAVRQPATELGDGGVVVGQPAIDLQRLSELGLGLRQPASFGQMGAEVAMDSR